MQKFNYVVDEIRTQAEQIKFRFLGETEGGKPVIFGAGDCGHKIYALLRSCSIQVLCFCDNGQGGNVDEATGLKIIKPEELRDMADSIVILVCVENKDAHQSICRQLASLGFDKAQIHLMNEYFYWQTWEYLEGNIENYKKAYQLLEDEFSRQVYLEKMKKVFLLSDISDIVSPNEEGYFDEKVVLTDEEMFIDCGGFDGDSSVRFIEKCGGRYRGIAIFEPEVCKKEAIERNMGANRYELYQLGVWSKNTQLCFKAAGTSGSHVSEKAGGYTIQTAALDDVVYDKKPTYIKMDIEGAEQEALKGCRKIIQTYKPKLAVCIYHKPNDMFEIPIMIKEMNSEYQLYVRQYANAWYDTVLYAL